MVRAGAGEVAERYDVIVVGAGSSGCALASRLSEDSGRSVLLVEAGAYYGGLDRHPWALRKANVSAASMPGSADSWHFLANLTGDLAYPVTRGKVVGGSSAVNGALFLRGHPDDFDRWAKAGNTEWSFDKVLPAYVRQETDLDLGSREFHGATGPMPVKRPERADLAAHSEAFLEACLGLGTAWDDDVNGPGSSGVGLLPTNAVDGIRQNAAVRYLEPVLARRNLTLLDRTSVARVLFVGRRAVGVATSAGSFFADEVVLCAGALQSPQLLMVSGVGPPELLGRLGIPLVHASPSVGRGLMDHPTAKVSYSAPEHRAVEGPRPIAEVALHQPMDGIAQGPVRIMPMIYSMQQMLLGTLRGHSLVERLRGAGFLSHPVQAVRGLAGTSRQALRHDLAYRSARSLNCSLTTGESRGELSLVSADPTVAPRIDYRYMTEEADRRRMREGVRLAVEIVEHDAFQQRLRPIRISPTDEDLATDSTLDAWILQNLGTTYHSTSTCRMGPDGEDTAVVDQHGRVYGVASLSVLDLSILPTVVGRPPAATAIMVGERGAEFLASG